MTFGNTLQTSKKIIVINKYLRINYIYYWQQLTSCENIQKRCENNSKSLATAKSQMAKCLERKLEH